ncbi:hypothetical protein, partial [Streptomyces sp. NPDC001833]|uniref:hypothetical protein n=1 Tax=Streptomyces sp. NPDC001833 TaxID=3154658 RepID=UPI00331C9F54
MLTLSHRLHSTPCGLPKHVPLSTVHLTTPLRAPAPHPTERPHTLTFQPTEPLRDLAFPLTESGGGWAKVLGVQVLLGVAAEHQGQHNLGEQHGLQIGLG